MFLPLAKSRFIYSNAAKLIEFQQLAFECYELQKGHSNNCASGQFDWICQGDFRSFSWHVYCKSTLVICLLHVLITSQYTIH